MHVFMLNEQMDYEFDSTVGVFSSFETAMQKLLDILNSNVDRPDRFDRMQGKTQSRYFGAYVNHLIMEKQVDGDGESVNVWFLEDEEAIQFSYTVEFQENGGHFTMEWLQCAIEDKSEWLMKNRQGVS